MKPEVDMAAELATEFARKNLDELDVLEEAIKRARAIKADMKQDDVPKEDVIELQAAWKLADAKKRVSFSIDIVIETSGCGSDPCSVTSYIVEPEWLANWCEEPYGNDWGWPKWVYEAMNAHEKHLKEALEIANRIRREFEEKHDVPAHKFLE